jgi:signal transduction histidine kinase
MRDNHTPTPRSHRGTHARPSSVTGRISASVSRPPRKTWHAQQEQQRAAEAPRARMSRADGDSVLEPLLRLGRRFTELRTWEPGGLRQIPHPRSIRAKVVCLLMVPIVSLMTLWGLAAVQAAQNVFTLIQLKQLNTAVHAPADNVISSLQQERIGIARLLGGHASGQPDADLNAEFATTDAAALTLRTGAGAAAAPAAGLGADVEGRISTLLSDLNALPTLRGEAARRQVTWATVQAGYAKAIDDALSLENGLATVQDGQVASDAWPVLALARSREMLARQAALVGYAQAGGGGLDADGYQQFAGAYYTQYELEQAALPDLRATDAAAYRRVTSAASYQRLRGAQLTVLNAGVRSGNGANGGGGAGGAAGAGGAGVGGVTEAEETWASLAPVALTGLGGVVANAGTAAIAQADPYGHALATKAGVGVVLGLIAVTASLLVSVWIGRRLVVDLVGLRDSALDLARRRLPRAISRLRSGESLDLAAEAPVGAAGGSDEVGQVVEALATVHQAALRAAVERAEAVSGVAGVFLNLARRSQVLLHRQLALLDLMERRVDDPTDLEDLFRLDHLATRMRRHAEGLIILSGAVPGRGWRRPVPLVDVVRAAVAEVEDYARVDVRQMPDVHVAGGAVADLAHLLAELVENATAFSPPHTRVQVQGEQVAAGYVVEIEDRGLGMGIETLNEANRRIDSDRQSDLFDTDRLGLFVVSRLARRHEIRVALRTSVYGGTTAVVLLPKALLGGAEAPVLARPAARAHQSIEGAGARQQGSADRSAERAAVLVGAGSGSGAGSGAGSGSGSAAGESAATAASASGAGPVSAAGAGPGTRRGFDTGLGAGIGTGAGAGPGVHTDPDMGTGENARYGPGSDPETDPAAAAAAGAGAQGSTGPETPDGLPRRVRQANLAPGLRGEAGQSRRARDDDREPAARSPEQARDTRAAYQNGWSLGRVSNDSTES